MGVTIHETAGTASFVDPHTIETGSGLRVQADSIILCAAGTSRRLPIPGFELTATHSDAWGLTELPPSMLVVVQEQPGCRSPRSSTASARASSSSRPASASCRPRTKTCRQAVAGRLPRGGHGGARELRCHRSLREDAERRANGVLKGRRTRQRGGRSRGGGGRLGGRHRRAELGQGRRRDRFAGLCARRLPIFGPPHRMSSRPATSPAA